MLGISIGLIFILSGLSNRLALLSQTNSQIIAAIGFVLVVVGCARIMYRRWLGLHQPVA